MSPKPAASLCTVLDPRGQPTKVVEPVPLAPRLDTLEGKTIHLIDVGFGGGWEFLEEAAARFERNMPASRRCCGTIPASCSWMSPRCGRTPGATPTRSSAG